jgi:4-amino-4-deoxy-L-arabinose transferase-like glycosyltransferase
VSRRFAAALALLASLLFFVAIGTFSLREPGLQYDEAFEGAIALEVLDGREPRCAQSMRVLGHALPLMVHPHIGATSVYTSLVGLALVGPSVEGLRLSQLAVGAIALVLLFALALTWFDVRAAAIAVLLCGSAPGFIWWSRGGANWTVPLLPATLACLLALTLWWRRRRPLALAVAAFCLGFGITTKILFVWLVLPALLTAMIAIGPRALRAALYTTSRATLGFAVAALLLGLAPLIAYNVPEPRTFSAMRANAGPNAWGHDNRRFVANVVQAASSYLALTDGEVQMATPDFGSPIGRAAFLLALVWVGAGVVRRGQREATADLASAATQDDTVARTFLVAVPLTVLPQSAFTTSVVSSTYTFLIVPLTWLLVAVLIADLTSPRHRGTTSRATSRILRAIGLALLGLLLANHVETNVDLLRFFARTGGYAQWSDAIDRTTAIVEREHAAQPVVALDWGFARNIELLTGLRRTVTEGHEFLPAPSPRYVDSVQEFLQPGTILLAHTDAVAMCRGCLATAQEAASRRGVALALRHAVHDREGHPHTEIYEVVRNAEVSTSGGEPGSGGTSTLLPAR